MGSTQKLCYCLVRVHMNLFLLSGTPIQRLERSRHTWSSKFDRKQITELSGYVVLPSAFCWPSLYISRKIATFLVYGPCTKPIPSFLLLYFSVLPKQRVSFLLKCYTNFLKRMEERRLEQFQGSWDRRHISRCSVPSEKLPRLY